MERSLSAPSRMFSYVGQLASPVGGIFTEGRGNRRLQVGQSRSLGHQLNRLRRQGNKLAILSSLLLFYTSHVTWKKQFGFV